LKRELTGVLNCNKPAGWTSFDVIRKLRSALGVKKMGHTGSLDPIATGVLVICLGKATRLVQLLMVNDKEYIAEFRFGAATDTYDSEGKITFEGTPPDNLTAAIEEHLGEFQGEIMQTPPPYSAAKKDGERLYKLAREGKPTDVPPRQVTLHRFELTRVEGDLATLKITCSKGTYVRGLAHELGKVIGCGAHLTWLTRTRNGIFNVEDGLSVDIARAELGEAAEAAIIPPEKALAYLPKTEILGDDHARYLNGMAVPMLDKLPLGQQARVFGPRGFIGVGTVEPGHGGAAIHPTITINR